MYHGAEAGDKHFRPERARAVLHLMAFGNRDPVEQEHDLNPRYAVCYDDGPAGPLRLARDEQRDVPAFRVAGLAVIVATGLARHPGFEATYVVPVWTDGLVKLMVDQALGSDYVPGASAAEIRTRGRVLGESLYFVEDRAAEGLEEDADPGEAAVAYARDLPRRIVLGVSDRDSEALSAALEDRLHGGAT